MVLRFISGFFDNFARNMMFIHLSVAGLFFVLWMLDKYGVYRSRGSELAFGIGAIAYGVFLIGYYIYFKKHK